jgi:hypothetical protein
VDPAGLGWCKACGYCRSLEGKAAPLAPSPAGPSSSVVATGAAVGQLPGWSWITLVSVATLALGTWSVNRYVLLTPLARAQWTSIQIFLGLDLMGIAQLLGVLRLAPEDPTLRFVDAVMPFRLYGLIFKHLPATRWSLYLGCWGLTLIVGAVVFIGGLGHWFKYLPRSQ